MSAKQPAVKGAKPGSSYNPLVPAVDQASRLLICLAKSPSFKMSLTEICRELGIHKSKGFSILHTLQMHGFVEKDPGSKAYSLGPGLLPLSRRVLDHLDLGNIVVPFLDSLARETDSTALLGLVSGEHVFVVAKRQANIDVGVTVGIGHRFRLTAGAHGKAIVAFMPERERARILGRKNLYFYGQPGDSDLKGLEEELARCRQRGYAVDMGGLLPGINAISSPIMGPSGRIIGCIILIGAFGKSLISRNGRKVAETTHGISGKLGNS